MGVLERLDEVGKMLYPNVNYEHVRVEEKQTSRRPEVRALFEYASFSGFPKRVFSKAKNVFGK